MATPTEYGPLPTGLQASGCADAVVGVVVGVVVGGGDVVVAAGGAVVVGAPVVGGVLAGDGAVEMVSIVAAAAPWAPVSDPEPEQAVRTPTNTSARRGRRVGTRT